MFHEAITLRSHCFHRYQKHEDDLANPVSGKSPPELQARSAPLSAYPGALGIALGCRLSCTRANVRLVLRFKASESIATLVTTSPFRPARAKAILDMRTPRPLSARVNASWYRALAVATAFGPITERCRCVCCGLQKRAPRLSRRDCNSWPG